MPLMQGVNEAVLEPAGVPMGASAQFLGLYQVISRASLCQGHYNPSNQGQG